MKHILLLIIGLALLPHPTQAQLELGFDAGMRVENMAGMNLTTFMAPAEQIRIGAHSKTLAFEALMSFTHQRMRGASATVIKVLPGLVYYLPADTYIRGEVGALLVANVGSASQFGYGIAAGNKRQIGPGPLYLRIETGVDKWVENWNYAASTEYRFLVGLSIVLGGNDARR